jgi:hypothetical protein
MVKIFCDYAEYLLVVIAIGFLFAPIIHYLIGGWVAKQREILSSFTEQAMRRYFKIFFPADFGASKNPKLDFTNLYNKRFGRRHFIIPVICLLAIVVFLAIPVSWTVFLWLRKESNYQLDLPPLAVAAVAGAYMWVLYDFIRRTQLCDLGPANLYMGSFRFAVAIPLGFAVAALFKDEVGVTIAFLLGAFPAGSLFTLGRRIVMSKLNMGDNQEDSSYELENLQGIGRVEAERFADEGVTRILQLAYADPIELTIRTNFSFSYVVDCCSQALAWLYFQQDLAKMRRFGLRGGQEIYTLVSNIDKLCPSKTRSLDEIANQAKKCLELVAAEMKMDTQALERPMREIAEDPYTCFLCDVWCETAEVD